MGGVETEPSAPLIMGLSSNTPNGVFFNLLILFPLKLKKNEFGNSAI